MAGWACTVAIIFVSASTVAADAKPNFDKPSAVLHAKGKTGDDKAGAFLCTRFPDLMLREDASDTPAPDKATLFQLGANAKPNCGPQVAGAQIQLDTEGMAFEGRKGDFLIFSLIDTNGFMPFTILDAQSGKVLFRDSMVIKNGIAGVALDGPALQLRYRRAISGSCGLPRGGADCWSTMIHEANIPLEIGSRPAPLQACNASYRAGKAPIDDPSIVSYDVTLTLAPSGNAKSVAYGNVGCEPAP
jgi:hypothetical protein